MKNNKRNDILSFLNELAPNAKCELNFNSDYECLLAVMLSAQTTDKRVNEVTSKIFSKYKSLDELKNIPYEELVEDIKPLGLIKNKVEAFIDIINKLINEYNYKVPNKKEELLKMKGVGNKVANVVIDEIYNGQEFPVDTHIYRISKRLKICKKDDSILICEEKLKKFFKGEDFHRLHHQLIYFGRYFCSAKKPNCLNCKLKNYCLESKNNLSSATK